jgi:hypothetical protein
MYRIHSSTINYAEGDLMTDWKYSYYLYLRGLEGQTPAPEEALLLSASDLVYDYLSWWESALTPMLHAGLSLLTIHSVLRQGQLPQPELRGTALKLRNKLIDQLYGNSLLPRELCFQGVLGNVLFADQKDPARFYQTVYATSRDNPRNQAQVKALVQQPIIEMLAKL